MQDDELIKNIKFEMPGKSYSNKATSVSTNVYEWLETIAQALMFVTVIYVFIFCQVRVDGDSMTNTLQNNDRLVVWRWGYEPKNNDIVVISKGQHFNEPIIKRVIATEGQTLNIDYSSGVGVVTVDGVTLDEVYIREPMLPPMEGDGIKVAEVPSKIPKDFVFVMGDNRNDSADSRYDIIGLINKKDIVGKATFRLYPFNKIGNL